MSSGAPAPSSSSAPPAGETRALEVPSRPLRARVEVTLWSPAGVADGTPLPLLAVHDGPEYEARTGLTAIVAGLAGGGRIAPHRVALLAPGPRDEWYSASAFYARALAGEVLPAIGRAVAVDGAPVGIGASLGGLAMLHAQRRHPGAFGGLFLQSGSFFMPRFDHMEKDFAPLRADRPLRARACCARSPSSTPSRQRSPAVATRTTCTTTGGSPPP